MFAAEYGFPVFIPTFKFPKILLGGLYAFNKDASQKNIESFAIYKRRFNILIRSATEQINNVLINPPTS